MFDGQNGQSGGKLESEIRSGLSTLELSQPSQPEDVDKKADSDDFDEDDFDDDFDDDFESDIEDDEFGEDDYDADSFEEDEK